jgi:hypothetical protein
MAALIAPRVTLVRQWAMKKATFPLGIGAKAWEGGMACIDSARVGAVWPGSVATTLKDIGWFMGSVDNSAGGATVPVPVELTREKWLQLWDSVGGGGAITNANLFQQVYIASDHELTTVATGASPVGIVWLVGGVNGYPNAIGIEPLF